MSFKLKVLGLMLPLCAVEAAIAQQPPPSGLACALDVPIPGYRGVFWIARVVGEAKVTLTIGPGGATTSVEVRSAQPALVAWLKPALLASTFLDRCAGQTVEIKFIYRVLGVRRPSLTTRFEFGVLTRLRSLRSRQSQIRSHDDNRQAKV